MMILLTASEVQSLNLIFIFVVYIRSLYSHSLKGLAITIVCREFATMQHPKALVLFLVLLVPAYAKPNLFDDGQLGTMLGTSFGIPGANATFDYVIVGGGTAGLTIATRLAEDPSLSVAVVEAGGFSEIDNGNLSVVPGLSSWFTGWDSKNFQPLIDWGFTTVPQPVC